MLSTNNCTLSTTFTCTLLTLLLSFNTTSHAQTTMSKWALTTDGTPSSVATNVTASNFTGGSGIGSITYSSSGGRASSWSSVSLNTDDYFQITVKPNTGYDLTINEILFDERRSNSGIRDYQVQYSKSSTFSSATTLNTVNVPDNDNSRSGDITGQTIVVSDGETLYLRFFGYNSESSSGNWRIDDNSLEIKGSVVAACTQPANQASGSSASSITTTGATLSWTKGTGSNGSIVILNAGSVVAGTPSSGSTYSANATYGSGDALGSTVDYVVFRNTTGTSVSVTGLTENTTYHYAIHDYMTVDNCYKTSSPETGSFTTACATPTAVTNETIAQTNSGELTIQFTDPTCYDGVIIIAKEGSAPTTSLSTENASTFSGANSVYGTSGSDVTSVTAIAGKTDEYVVYQGTGNNVSVTGLDYGNDYYFEIFTYKGTTWTSSTISPNLNEQAVDLLGCQDFETTPTTPTLEIADTGNTVVATGNGTHPNTPMYVSGSQGRKVNNGTETIEFGPVDATGYANYTFSMRLAAFGTSNTSGLDENDDVTISISEDGGTTWSKELIVSGNSNARWSFAGGTGVASADYDGNNTVEATKDIKPAAGNERTADGYSTLKLSKLPNSASLTIRVELKNGANSEIWVMDDAKLTGVPAPEIDVFGNNKEIADGSTSPSRNDNTYIGTVDAGTGTDAQTFTIENPSTELLTLSGSSPYITITGTDAADFSITTIPTVSISGGIITSFVVTFDPSAATTGLRNATINIASNDIDESTYTFDIQGLVANNCVEPTNAPTALTLTSQSTNTTGSFTAAAVGAQAPTGYLTVAYPTGSIPTAPTDGTVYKRGEAIGLGTVVGMSSTTSFTAFGLLPSSTYDLYVYSYSDGCAGEADYNTTALTLSTTTTSGMININAGATGPSTIATRAAATALNNTWETAQQNKGVTCSGNWNTVYGDLDFTLGTAGPGDITGLTQTNLTTSSGAGTAYIGTAQWTLRDFELDPDNPLGGTITDHGAQTLADNNFHGVKTNSNKMQDNSPSPDGVDEYFTSSKSTSHRSGIEFTLNPAVDDVGFFIGDVETTTAANGGNNPTAAIVATYDASGNEIERKIIPTSTLGGNCTANTTGYGGGNSCAVGCGSTETTWINATSSTANIAKIRVIVGDFVDQTVTSGCTGSLPRNAGKDRGKNEHLSFGGFTLGGNCTTTLPVDLLHFYGELTQDNTTELHWSTALEENNSHFEIQKSTDGTYFYTIDQVEGQGNSSSLTQYTYPDLESIYGKTFYRLKQVDFDGGFEYSKVAILNPKTNHLVYDIHPNPSNGRVRISGSILDLQSVVITNSMGQEVYNTNRISRFINLALDSGIYWILMKTNSGEVHQKKLILY